MTILEQYLARTPRSAALAARAKQALPGGVVTDTRVFDPYGIYVDRAEGAWKWDVDDNRYLDLFGGHGANMLGHAPPAVVEAVRDAVGKGVQFAANQPLEVELAERVIRMVPSAEKVRFTGSGTEATLLALRLARAFTGREKVVRFATHYHGWHDHAASGYAAEFDGSPAPGVLAGIAEGTVLLPPGDEAALARAVEQHGSDIAAFLIEPVGCHFGVVPLREEFLRSVEQAARATGALFILDEVLSGFRAHPGGVQAILGLKPDLTTLAKVLCGAMPGGGVAGRADVLALLDADEAARGGRPKVLHQGTFTGNPVSMAAGIVTLDLIERTGACDKANRLGAMARERLNALFEAERLPVTAYGDYSIFHLFFGNGPTGFDRHAHPPAAFLARPQPLTNRLRMALNLLGVDVNTRCSGLFGAAHEEEHVEQLVKAMQHAFSMLRAEGLAPTAATA